MSNNLLEVMTYDTYITNREVNRNRFSIIEWIT